MDETDKDFDQNHVLNAENGEEDPKASNDKENAQNDVEDSTPDELAELGRKLATAESKSAEHLDNWLRAKAETQNVRKRSEAELANARKFGIENFAKEVLPVKDSLEAALLAKNTDLKALKSGVEITLKQIENIFASNHIDEINPVGEKLDPNLHQAMSTEDSELPQNTVTAVLQKGYSLNGRLIRPALVTVAKKAAESQQETKK